MKTFKHGKITLLNCDCMEYMAQCKENEFDLAIVDPPYGIGMDGGSIGKSKKHSKKNWDKCSPEKAYFDELIRISKNSTVWGGNYFCDKLPISKAWIYWDKMQDGFGHTFSSGELAWTNFTIPMCQIRYKWQGNYCGFENSITTKTNTGELNIHPTQKPVAIYKWLLSKYAKQSMRILDTHLGSGSSAIAAHYFGCEFVGMEIDSDYFDAAVERFKRETRQTDLFLYHAK